MHKYSSILDRFVPIEPFSEPVLAYGGLICKLRSIDFIFSPSFNVKSESLFDHLVSFINAHSEEELD